MYCALFHTYKRYMTVTNIFDKKIKRLQRDRAISNPNYKLYEILKDEVAYNLADRIKDIKRKFWCTLDFGCLRGHLSPFVDKDMIGYLVQYEMSHQMLVNSEVKKKVVTCKINGDNERPCFRNNIFDLVVSNLSMHWINDIPDTLSKIHKMLIPDGAFIGTMFSHDTLYELRSCLQLAEIERSGGFSPRISPFVKLDDMGRLLHNAGFKLLTLDVDEIVINYPNMFELMFDLRGMAESKAFLSTHSKQKLLGRDTIISAAALYQNMYSKNISHITSTNKSTTGVPATFQILNMIGWKADPSQPQPAKRGSGKISFKDLNLASNSRLNSNT